MEEIKKKSEKTESHQQIPDFSKLLYSFKDNKLYLYDLLTKKSKIEIFPNAKKSLYQSGTCKYLNKIYLAGGAGLIKNTQISEFFGFDVLDADLNITITNLPNMIYEKEGNSLIMINSMNLYTVGGVQKQNPISKCEKYNFELSKWIEIKPLNEPKYNGSLINMKNCLFYIGGATNGKIKYGCEKYDTENEKEWEITEIKGFDFENYSLEMYKSVCQINEQEFIIFTRDSVEKFNIELKENKKICNIIANLQFNQANTVFNNAKIYRISCANLKLLEFDPKTPKIESKINIF